MYIKISGIKVQENKFGNDLVINRIGLYDDNYKWVKWIKLDNKAVDYLLNNYIDIGTI